MMKKLLRESLANVPLAYETVESFYDGSRSGTAEQCLEALCRSHERLRAELQGVEIMLNDRDAELESTADKLSDCWLLLDQIARHPQMLTSCRAAAENLLKKQQCPGWKTPCNEAVFVDQTPRCEKCGWPLAKTMEQGCIPGNCSMREKR